jgi:glutamate-1-semialdehyde 2,1-aminomutase
LATPFNGLASLAAAFERFPDEIEAVIVEPVVGNMGVVPLPPGFLARLQEITRQHSALLVFDEAMTGFRVHPSGAQMLYNIQPDPSGGTAGVRAIKT